MIKHSGTYASTIFNYCQIGPTWSLHVVKKQPMDGLVGIPHMEAPHCPLIVQPCGVIVVALCPVHVEGRQVLGNNLQEKRHVGNVTGHESGQIIIIH